MLLKFGSDLDDCILKTADSIVSLLNSRCNMSLGIEDVNTFYFEELLPKNYHNIIRDSIGKVLENSGELEVVPFSVEVLNWINNFCDKIYIISHRPSYLYYYTRYVLENIGLSSFELILTYEDDDCDYIHKYEAINDLGIDIFVEDRPSTISNLYNHSQCSNILVYDRPWNKQVSENDRILICKNWADIRNYFFVSYLENKCKCLD